MRVFNLPDLGEGLQEAEIVEWHVASGQTVAADEVMVSVETDKAIVEIPAPYEGKIEKLFGQPGDVVHVGAPLVGFEGAAQDTGTVVGEIEREPEAPAAAPAAGPGTGVRAAPAVRALAQRLGVDLAQVSPSGPQGSVTLEDVKRSAAAGAQGAEPLRGMRRAMARNMALAHSEVAAVTVMDDADVEAWRAAHTLMPRLVRAVIVACRAEPGLNAWYDAETASRQVFEAVHVGIAVDTPEGLLVPVLRGCQDRAPAELAGAIEALVREARARKLPPERLRGATITISNYGAIAGRYASPIVVPPTIAILGAGRLARRPVVQEDGRIAARSVLPLSMTFDHRAATGGEAGRFLRAAIADLEQPD